ncbi:hypothetical protein L249_6073 [Ophiocordyceps polyrhachis-furcata BCC 54312]|uniref:HSF-type DNA-binding domain-containing protein n=1 Tax=Ophiocordyceps polyrhachis-furcata BCC 54312 TaxID=1330021 RepID=A0A367LIA8_9HYPO|nr:hypothetical protein L249_6073 [Ophiocordyceps polyrhachis-furcata BCC 54312]
MGAPVVAVAVPVVAPVAVPVLNMSAPGSGIDAMDVAFHRTHDPEINGKSTSARSNRSSPPDQNSSSSNVNMPAPPPSSSSSSAAAAAAAAAAGQPKIVQTAFIHKLYNMLEDSSIQHLISWSANAESFVMSPSADFSKVLSCVSSSYFKHTNISSFVRQLNMYGFHKERDVFHTGNPDTTLWEFKHGNGNFKRGDLTSLREIKRRASRHALVHRESSYTKQPPAQQGATADPAQMAAETWEARLANLESSMYDMGARLQRGEETAYLRNQAMTDVINRLLHFNQELSRALLSIAPVDNPAHRDVATLQTEMQRQVDALRMFDEPHEAAAASARQQFLGSIENAPVSPRQLAQDDIRRTGGLAVPSSRGQPLLFRPGPATSSSGMLASARRPYGSISSSSTTQSSPLRNANPPAPPPHPLAHVEPPSASLARRHTAADIRAHGWQPAPPPTFSTASNPPTTLWPPSPEDQRIRDSLSTYTLQGASHPRSRPATPPPSSSLAPSSHGAVNGGNNGCDTFGSWSWNSTTTTTTTTTGRDMKSLAVRDSSAPPTRRGSMAHILNPSDTAERSDEDEEARGDDDRKRKRMQ